MKSIPPGGSASPDGDLPVSALCYTSLGMASDRPVREAENRLERFNAERERLLAEVERRVVARRVFEAKAGGDASLEYVLNDVAYCEIKRLDHKNGAAERWRDLSRRLMTMSEEEKQQELRELVRAPRPSAFLRTFAPLRGGGLTPARAPR